MRTIFEAVRTAVIWVVDLMIYYWFAPNSVYGESWNTYSWIQLAGFLLLIYSSQCYNAYTKYPFLKYKFDDEKKPSAAEKEPLLDGKEDDAESTNKVNKLVDQYTQKPNAAAG